MSTPLISLIIPVYNVEHYIDRCMQSVFAQTYRNLEIILIDDGSTDASGIKCDLYQKQDKRVRVLHKANGGLSSARNYGISAACGRYVICIDSDDYVDKDYTAYLFSLVERFRTKIGICQHRVLLPNAKTDDKAVNRPAEVLSAKECIERMLYHDVIDTTACAKIYERTLFQDISYPEGKLFEDIATTYKLMHESERIAVGYQSKYNYIIRKNSIVNGAFNAKKLELIEMTDKMAKDVILWYPDLRSAVRRRQAYARFSTLNQLAGVPSMEQERNKIIRELKKLQRPVMRDKRTPRRDKIAFLLLDIGYPFYEKVWNLWLKIEGKA